MTDLQWFEEVFGGRRQAIRTALREVTGGEPARLSRLNRAAMRGSRAAAGQRDTIRAMVMARVGDPAGELVGQG